MNAITTNSTQKWQISLLVAVAVTVTLLAWGNLFYETNDDTAIISLLTGRTGLKPTADVVFLSPLLANMLYKLYFLVGDIPWYGLVLYCALFFGFFLGCRIIFSLTTSHLHTLCSVTAFSCFYLYLFTRLNFGAVSLFLWSMTLGYIALLNVQQQQFSFNELFYGLLLGVSYLIRPGILPVALLVSLPAISTFSLPGSGRRARYIFLPFFVILTFTVCSNYIVQADLSQQHFTQFNKARSDFLDTPLSYPNDKTPAALLQAGWSQEDYQVLQHWWLHDGTIFSSEKINAFLKANGGTRSLISLGPATQALQEVLLYVLTLCFGLLALLASKDSDYATVAVTPRTARLTRVVVLVTISGIAALVLVRFPPRVAIPVFASLIIYAILLRGFLWQRYILHPILRVTVWTASFSLLVFLCFLHWQDLSKETAFFRADQLYRNKALSAVRQLNGTKTIFVSTDIGSVHDYVNPLRDYKDMPDYLRMPMGWLTDSKSYHDFLKRHGFGTWATMVPAMVDNGNVVLYFWDSPGDPFAAFAQTFLHHLQQHYASLFPKRTLMLQIVADCRYGQMPNGLIFYKIRTKASP